MKTILYGHIKRGSVRVKKGQVVKNGDELGIIGNTGYSTGPHCHLTVIPRARVTHWFGSDTTSLGGTEALIHEFLESPIIKNKNGLRPHLVTCGWYGYSGHGAVDFIGPDRTSIAGESVLIWNQEQQGKVVAIEDWGDSKTGVTLLIQVDEREDNKLNSKLVDFTQISPSSDNPRSKAISKITIHHMAGDMTIEACGRMFANAALGVSSNYAIGSDGRVGMFVEEKNRSWCSSSSWNDNQAITIEVANDEHGSDWHVSDKALAKLIELCVDICKRNNIYKLDYTGDQWGSLTRHNMFASTTCPGPYLQSKFPYIAEQVNKQLATASDTVITEDILYRVQVGAFSNFENAEKMAKGLEIAGYSIYLIKSDDLYKVQTGAFSVKENAEKMAKELQAKGFPTYITTKIGEATVAKNKKTLSVGDTVKVRKGAKSYEDDRIDDWVYESSFPIMELNGSRAVLGGIVTAFRTSDLTRG